MKPILPKLFDMTQVQKRQTPSQEEFIEKNLALLLALKDIVLESFDQFHDNLLPLISPGGGMDNKLPSIAIISFIRTKIIQQFPKYCGKATKGRFKLVSTDLCNIYLKKLDFRKRPSNRQSKANDLILYQLTKNKEDKGGNIFLGYITDPLYNHVLGIYAVCLEGKELVWECNILDLVAKQSAKVVKMKKKGNRIKLKPGAKKLGGDNKEANQRE